jgi:hypothetical protein
MGMEFNVGATFLYLNSHRENRPPQVEVLTDHGHLDKPQSVGLLWTRDRPVAETTTLQYATFTSMLPEEFELVIRASDRPQTLFFFFFFVFFFFFFFVYILTNQDEMTR